MGHCQKEASLIFFVTYYLVECSSELNELVTLPYSRWRSILYSKRLHDFLVTIPRCDKSASVKRFFLRMPVDYFPLAYDLNSYKSRVKIPFIFRFLLNTFRKGPHTQEKGVD